MPPRNGREASKAMDRNFFLGFVRVHILHHACQGPIYGAGIRQELLEHGYDLSPGTLYPLLADLQKRGYLRRSQKLVEGRLRKYYRCTPAGRAALEESKLKIAMLVEEVLGDKLGGGGQPPENSPA